MLRPSKSYLQEALTNNTFDMESTENALRMGLDHSFSYLYRLQRNMVDFEESHYTTRNEIDRPDFGDFYLDDNDFVCLNLPGEIVTQSFRENYRQSDYYNKEIPYDTLNEYHDTMFTRFPILFIDEKVVRHPYFEIKDDYFHVRTEETRSFLLKPTFDNKRWEYEYYDHTAWLQLVGHAYYQEVVTNASMLQLQSRTYDILRADYLSQFSFHDDESPGTYFVTAFCGHETLGTTLTDAEFDEYGNLHFYFGKEDLARIKACAEDITIRIYFYQYCHSYKSFHLKDAITYPNWYVRTMARGDSATTELITLNNGDQQYMMPIPIENLMLMKVNKDDVDSTGYTKRYHMMASDMQINYPNVYHQETGLEVGDRLRLFYFYVPAYELNYTNRYAFFKEYVETLFGLDYERAINRLYFCNNLTDATRNAAASVLLYYVQQLGIPSDTNIAYLYGNITNWLGSNLPLSLIIAQSTNISITSPPDPDTSELYEVWKDFGDEFYRIVFANYADYYYDEFDYDKKHSNIHPMEYKIEKLKSFIKDDPDIFLNYVRAQDVLPIKYTFEMNEATIANRTREMDVTGSYFSETMVEFAITSPYPDDEVSGRIFIDGIYASMSIFYHYADSEYIYVPLRYVTPGCLVEVEVLPEYIKKFPISFSLLKDKETIELPATPILYPTLQDIVIKDKETGEVIDHSEFAFSITSDEINYVDSENENVDIYYEKRTNGWVDRTHYYLEDGTYFTSDGFRKPEEDSSRQDIIRLLGAGLMVKATGNGYNNQYPILQDDHYVSYNDVFAGSSIIDRENKGLNFAHTATLTIQPKTHDIYDKELVLEIHKVPEHISSVIQSTTYPNYPNKPKYCQNPLDYLRVFKNGRLMSQKRYTQMESVDDGPIIQIMEKFTL